MQDETKRDEPVYTVVQALYSGFFNTHHTIFDKCFAGKESCNPDIDCGECRLCKLQETVHHLQDVLEKMGYKEDKSIEIIQEILKQHLDMDAITQIIDHDHLQELDSEEAAEDIVETLESRWNDGHDDENEEDTDDDEEAKKE